MEALAQLYISGVSWGRNTLGLITRPYETYRKIVERGRVSELWYTALLLAAYFGLASIVKVAAFRPFLLTRQFAVLSLGALVNFVSAIAVFSVAARAVGAPARLSRLIVAWGYTLLPTVTWFLMTSFLYVILPPPRTTSMLGVTFSIVFLAVSATVLWWKATLSYLTVRFVYRLSLGKMITVFAIALPLLALESVYMYRWGFFRVPFL